MCRYSLAKLKKFIDLSAEMGWPYTLIDANWNKAGAQPMEDLVAYAKSKSSDPFHGLGWTDAGAIGAGILANHDRWALGATYALYANILLKLEYDIQKDTVLGRKDNVLRVQAAVHF